MKSFSRYNQKYVLDDYDIVITDDRIIKLYGVMLGTHWDCDGMRGGGHGFEEIDYDEAVEAFDKGARVLDYTDGGFGLWSP